MDLSGDMAQVDGERIYGHVFKLEGTRHPVDAPQRLNEVADYIHSEFERCGLAVSEQEVKIEGFDGAFRNVEGLIGDGVSPELLVVAHYDTVPDCPGANDNASAVAVMLEAARVLAEVESIRTVRFVGFTLEERNPVHLMKSRRLARGLGLMDDRYRYTSMHAHAVMKRLGDLQRKGFSTGKSPAEALAEAREQLEGEMTESEVRYAMGLEEMMKGITSVSWAGKLAVIGSNFWVEETLRTKKEILGVLCLDTIGYTSEKEHSQTLPKGVGASMFQTYNVKDVTIGNFLAIIGSPNSGSLLQSFCAQCKLDSVGLPYACIQVPLEYGMLAQMMPDLLRSDHAPFWRAGIPTVFLTDTADFRYPYYHTQADTIDKLDFGFLTKICRATVATVVDLAAK